MTAIGTVQSRHRQRPLSGLCLTSSVSYQGVILVLHSRLTLSCRHRVLHSGCPKGKSRVTQRYPREVLHGTTGRVRPTYWCTWTLIVVRESYQNHESRALRERRETR